MIIIVIKCITNFKEVLKTYAYLVLSMYKTSVYHIPSKTSAIKYHNKNHQNSLNAFQILRITSLCLMIKYFIIF